MLDALPIEVSAFRIAGGALLFLLSLDMIFARNSGMRRTRSREQEEIAEEQEDVSVFPLAIPFISGPGSLATVLLYTDGDFWTTAAVMVVLLVVLLLTLTSLFLAPRIMNLFGETDANVLARVLGVLLAALAVQFLVDGIKERFAM